MAYIHGRSTSSRIYRTKYTVQANNAKAAEKRRYEGAITALPLFTCAPVRFEGLEPPQRVMLRKYVYVVSDVAQLSSEPGRRYEQYFVG